MLTTSADLSTEGRGRLQVPERRVAGSSAGVDPLAGLLARVTAEAVRDHQWALQQIADLNGGNRASGTAGYDESAAYVAERLTRAGYAVRLETFDFVAWLPKGPAAAEQIAPLRTVYVEGKDFNVVHHSEPGDVSGPVTAVDLRLDAPEASTSGCEKMDFADFPAGNVALIQRGGCSFRQKAERAASAGAVAVVLFNQGHAPAYRGLFGGTLTADYAGGIPVFGATFEHGLAWASAPGLRLHLRADLFRGRRPSANVIAETRRGRPDRVVVAGAHLDSVPEGPGVQDNGSGSAALLAVAEAFATVEPANRVRFAWWAAEEAGLVGSSRHVAGLSTDELHALAVYLNFDMIGSPNYARFVLDGDGSTFGEPGPPGSEIAESVFQAFYASRGLAFAPGRLTLRSDYAPFAFASVPVGGLFTGAEGIKTEVQAAQFGGIAGAPYDPCYHEACDTFDNVDVEVLEDSADAMAHAIFVHATSGAPLPGAAKRAARPVPERLRYHPDHGALE